MGGLELIKVSASDETKRIPGVTLEIRGMDGALIETVTTGDNDRVHVDLDAGDYYCVELKAAEGFKINATPHYFTIWDNETTTLTVAVSGTAANGYQFTNRADAGGKYQGTWQTAQGTWVTVIRRLTPTVTPKLPKTGY